MARYSEAFKRSVVKKILPSSTKPMAEMAEEVGVCEATLYRWRHAAMLLGVSDDQPPAGKRADEWTLKEKLKLLAEASELSDEELGPFLRSRGVHEAELVEWREALEQALSSPRGESKKKKTDSKRIRDLERELRRKDKALAETAALLVLQKKVQAIWGDEDDDTKEESER